MMAGCAGDLFKSDAQRNQEYIDGLGYACMAKGYKREDPAIRQCMRALDDQNRAKAAAVQPYKPYVHKPYEMPTSRTTTTNCTQIGNTLSCTSQ
jgi:hypothetical protein